MAHRLNAAFNVAGDIFDPADGMQHLLNGAFDLPDFELPTLTNALRGPLCEFLDLENRTTTFTNDRVSQFYGLPIVDISAAVRLAMGYC